MYKRICILIIAVIAKRIAAMIFFSFLCEINPQKESIKKNVANGSKEIPKSDIPISMDRYRMIPDSLLLISIPILFMNENRSIEFIKWNVRIIITAALQFISMLGIKDKILIPIGISEKLNPSHGIRPSDQYLAAKI